jgi:hypothetical protein
MPMFETAVCLSTRFIFSISIRVLLEPAKLKNTQRRKHQEKKKRERREKKNLDP